MLVEGPKFSKFLHGMALLYPETLMNTPTWFTPDGTGHMRPAVINEMSDMTDPNDTVRVQHVTLQHFSEVYCTLASLMLSQTGASRKTACTATTYQSTVKVVHGEVI